jgi:hypothetical protein
VSRPHVLFFAPSVAAVAVLSLAGCGLEEFPRAGAGGMGMPGPTPMPQPTPRPTPTPMPMPMPTPGMSMPGPGPGPAPAPTPPPSMPAPVPTGDGVVIGGTAVPRDKVIVFLHLGHSNMAGRTSTPPEMRPLNFETHPMLWAYAKGGAWRPAKEPLSGDYLTKGGAGPGMSILRTALDLAPDAYLVSIGRGHDGSIGGYCRNFRKGALMYDYVMGPAIELKGRVRFGAIFTMLGVNEFRRDAANLTRFHECLEGIAADMRGDLGDPDIPFLMGDWEAGATGAFDPTHDYAITTKMQLRIAQMNIRRSGIIASDGLPMSDDHHYNLVGYKMWAERGFAILKMSGWIPWASNE